MKKYLFVSVAVISVATIGITPSAMAQENVAAVSGSDEIVVTARKKNESLQDVPIAVSVVSGEQVAAQGALDLGAITLSMPAVNVSKSGAGDTLVIRGIGSGENAGFEQSVGYVLDGVSIGRSRATRAGLLDVERIEVLKGPQTTYFGANTIAGVINVKSRSASLTDGLSGKILSSYEFETDGFVLDGAINLPISETLAVRVAGNFSDAKGYLFNPFLNRREGGDNNLTGRISLFWEPSDNFNAEFKYTKGASKSNAAINQQLINCVPGGSVAQLNCVEAGGKPVDGTFDRISSHDAPEMRKLDFDVAQASLNYKLGSVNITSVTGFYKFKNEFLLDLDLSAVPSALAVSRLANNQSDKAEQFSQEIRISSETSGPFSWMIGGYFQDEDIYFTAPSLAAFAPPAPVASYSANVQTQDAKTYSAFGTAIYEITDRLTVTLGARYLSVTKNHRATPSNAAPIPAGRLPDFRTFVPTIPYIFETASRTDNKFLPSLDIQYDLTNGIKSYASYRKGFKGGGYNITNTPVNVRTNFIETFDPEGVNAYEVGFKGVFLGGDLRANLALFLADYSDRQVTVLLPSSTTVLVQAVTNAATSRSKGVEFDFSAQLSDRFSIKGDFTYLDAKFNSYKNANCYRGQAVAQGCVGGVQDLTGQTPGYAPEFAGGLTATYAQPLGRYNLSFEPNIFYSGRYFTSAPFNPLTAQSSFAKLNLRIALAPESENWELAFVGRNLTDKLTTHFCVEAPASSVGSVACGVDLPATYAVQASFRF